MTRECPEILPPVTRLRWRVEVEGDQGAPVGLRHFDEYSSRRLLSPVFECRQPFRPALPPRRLEIDRTSGVFERQPSRLSCPAQDFRPCRAHSKALLYPNYNPKRGILMTGGLRAVVAGMPGGGSQSGRPAQPLTYSDNNPQAASNRPQTAPAVPQ